MTKDLSVRVAGLTDDHVIVIVEHPEEFARELGDRLRLVEAARDAPSWRRAEIGEDRWGEARERCAHAWNMAAQRSGQTCLLRLRDAVTDRLTREVIAILDDRDLGESCVSAWIALDPACGAWRVARRARDAADGEMILGVRASAGRPHEDLRGQVTRVMAILSPGEQ